MTGGSNQCLDVPNSSGGTSRYTIQTGTIVESTHFGQSGVTECAGSGADVCVVSVIKSITLPDGSAFGFSFDCDPTGT